MSSKIRTLSVFSFISLIGLAFFGKMLPVSAPQSADAHLMSSAIPDTPVIAAPLIPSPIADTIPQTHTPTPHTSTPTPQGPATATPQPTRTPTPTPDMSLLDTRLQSDADLQAAVCQPDVNLNLSEGQIPIPILLYHFVGRDALESAGQSTTRYNVTAADFDMQLALLHRLGYQTVTISEVADAISGTLTLPARPIAITVDDGWVEQYTHIFPALKKYEMRATFYIPGTYPVGGRFVTWEQLKAMSDAGMEIGSHTHKHVDLAAQSAETAWRELTLSKKTLEEKLGITVYSVSYPFGTYSSSVIQLTQKAGYRAAVALGPTPKQSMASLYRLNRIEIFGTRDLIDFVQNLPWRGQGTALCENPQISKSQNSMLPE